MNPQAQTILPAEEVDITGCVRCANHEKTGIFMLCKHPSSVYEYGGKNDFHTCAHMRRAMGACGPEKRLIKHG